MFKDRKEAGQLLAEKLEAYRGKDVVVLALPRGGVVLGAEVARALKLPLDIVVVRKIGHPSSSEYAIGVVDENGNTILNERETRSLDPAWLKAEMEKERREAQRRIRTYRGDRERARIAGKTVILVDDGIATGFSMQLAVRAVKNVGAEKIIVAVPVASALSLPALTREGADEIILLESPQEFLGAVGTHYSIFDQTKDAEVVSLLQHFA